MFKKLLLCAVVLTLGACASTDSTMVQKANDNDFEINTGRAFKHRFVEVIHTSKTWEGTLAGGEEKIDRRKGFLMNMAAQEAARVCGPISVMPDGEPSFEMQDKGAAGYTNGILGAVIANALSSDENLPVSIIYNFTCGNEEL